MATAYRLKIKRLDFISAVDAGAQGPVSNVALIKRAPEGDEFTLTAKVAKLDESIGVVFGYAVASTIDGGASDHVDLQGDAVVGGDELIKVALGFAEAGARSDVMHNEVKDGWVPFVMPLSAETKKAFGLSGDVEGIAIGMKPSAETFKRFVSGELAAFSIGGVGERTPIGKAACAHGILKTPFCPQCGADMAAPDAAGDVADSDGTPVAVDDEPSSAKVSITVVAARAPIPVDESKSATDAIGKSPRSATAPQRGHMDEIKKLEIEKAELLKRAERAEAVSKLSDAQRAYLSTLTGTDADAFLAKSATERAAVLDAIEKANSVEYTSTVDGTVYRKSDDPRLIAMAKRADAAHAEVAKREAEIEKAEIAALAKSHLGNLAGGDDVHEMIVRSVRKSGSDTALVTKALDAMKGWNTLAKEAAAPRGYSGDSGATGNGMSTFVAKRDDFMKGKNLTVEAATVAFMHTPEGARLYGEATTTQPSA